MKNIQKVEWPAPLAADSGSETYDACLTVGAQSKTVVRVSNSYWLEIHKERLNVQCSRVSSCLSDPTDSFLIADAISLASAAMPF